MPNPNPFRLALKTEGRISRLRAELFGESMRKLDQRELRPEGEGDWRRAELPEDWNGLANGTYFIRLSLPESGGGALLLKMAKFR